MEEILMSASNLARHLGVGQSDYYRNMHLGYIPMPNVRIGKRGFYDDVTAGVVTEWFRQRKTIKVCTKKEAK